jgi:hypothetical protein
MSAFGLGAHRNEAAQFRDLKLESRVAALFSQSLRLAQLGATNLHPDDLKAQEQADAVRQRLAMRLHELEEKHYDSYETLLAFLVDNRMMPSIEKEKKNALQGIIPGTRVFRSSLSLHTFCSHLSFPRPAFALSSFSLNLIFLYFFQRNFIVLLSFPFYLFP